MIGTKDCGEACGGGERSEDEESKVNADSTDSESENSVVAADLSEPTLRRIKDGEAIPQFSITIFTIGGCPHCIRTKAVLKELSLEWQEINIGVHPERRQGMIELSGAHTVPQVFFDNEHIGDGSQVAELRSSGELVARALSHQAAMDEALREGTEPVRIDERLLPPPQNVVADNSGCGSLFNPQNGASAGAADSARSSRSSRSLSTDSAGIDNFIYIAEKHFKYSELLKQLCEVLDIRSRRYRLVVYDHVFVGSEATTVFQKFFGLDTREEAVAAGRELLHLNVFKHVTNDHDFEDGDLFYRLQLHSEPLILNSWRKFGANEDPLALRDDDGVDTDQTGSRKQLFPYSGRHALRVLLRCRTTFDELVSSATDQTTGLVDYVAIVRKEEFCQFQELVCRLQQCDIHSFSERQKLAFFLNLYNLMVQHAFVELGVPQSVRQRLFFFDAVKYSVGGAILSLNDVEHGILRGNAFGVFRFYRQFAARGDPRVTLTIRNVDPRIHFALNCGAKSCPAIKVYSVEHLEDELNTAACAFCQQPENVSVCGTSVRLSKIFKWYARDFGSTNDTMLLRICDWVKADMKAEIENIVHAGTARVSYRAYNWQPTSKSFREFEAANFRTNRAACIIS